MSAQAAGANVPDRTALPRVTALSLENFKAAGPDTPPVSLRPLTIVLGSNSSGKSTLIQSLVLLVQAVQGSVPDGEPTGELFPLNGERLQLGAFDDVRNALGDSPEVGVGFTLEVGVSQRWPVSAARATERVGDADSRALMPGRAVQMGREAFHCTFRIRLQGDVPHEPGAARISALDVDFATEGSPRRQQKGTEPQTISLRLEHSGEPATAEGEAEYELLVSKVFARDTLDARFTGRLFDGTGTTEELTSAEVNGGLPRLVGVDRPVVPFLFQQWLRNAVLRRPGSARLRRGSVLTNIRTGQVVDLEAVPLDTPVDVDEARIPVLQSVASRAADDIEQYLSQTQLVGGRRRTYGSFLVATGRDPLPSDIDPDEMLWIRKAVVDRLGSSEVTSTPIESFAWELLDGAVNLADRFLRTRVRHLGPLRAEPNQLSQPSPNARGGEVGKSGEYTADVLRTNAQKKIWVPLPEGGEDFVAFGTAVDAWAKYLNLAEHVAPDYVPGLGPTMKVRPIDVDRDVPTTAIGVGVSQLLPVLVVCLFAEPGTLVLLEQPELHLHPRAQQGLGDFLLACARSGRQLIVETHSEYLVTRLRKEIARDMSDDTMNHVGFVFVERLDGMTQYTNLEPNRVGGFQEWPHGFMDDASAEAKELLALAAEKRARLAENE